MRRSVIKLHNSSLKACTEVYLEYLSYANKEMPVLSNVFPKNSSGVDSVVEFHKQLCATAEENGHTCVGIKVISPNSDPVKFLKGDKAICAPLFSSMVGKNKFMAKSCNAQYIETGICFRFESAGEGSNQKDILRVAPAVEVTGSRFPFFAPTVHDLACDLCGTIGVVEGKHVSLSPSEHDILSGYHLILTHDNEPTEIGSGKLFEGGPLAGLQVARNYAEQLGFTLNQNHFVLCGSLSPRSPVRPGLFEVNWGKFGKATCTIV